MSRIILLLKLLLQRYMPLRFIIAGIWNTLFSYLVFVGLYHLWGGNGVGDIIVQVVSAIIGISNAYILHRFFTYQSKGVWWQEYLRFYLVYGGQVVLQAGCFFVFSSWLGWNGYIVQFVLVSVFTALSYWAHKVFSFKQG